MISYFNLFNKKTNLKSRLYPALREWLVHAKNVSLNSPELWPTQQSSSSNNYIGSQSSLFDRFELNSFDLSSIPHVVLALAASVCAFICLCILYSRFSQRSSSSSSSSKSVQHSTTANRNAMLLASSFTPIEEANSLADITLFKNR